MNFDDHDRTRAALRAVADEPAPPAATTLDLVVRRGRRRALVQRGATVAGVVAVVAAIGVGGVVLRSASAGEEIGPAGTSTTAPAGTTAPTAPSSAATSTQRGEPPSIALPPAVVLPGWRLVDVPGQDRGHCQAPPPDAEPDLGLPPRQVVHDRLVSAIRAQTDTQPQTVGVSWEPFSDKRGAPWGIITLNVPMRGGTGSVQLQVDRFGGTPARAADIDAVSDGPCASPSRRKLDDGTILQLSPPGGEPAADERLCVFQPNGRLYRLDVAGHGGSGRAVNGDGGYTIDSGRLPLDAAQLAAVAEALAALGR